jgi:hypothetical protein
MTKSLGINKPKKMWSADEIALLKHLYACTFTKTLAKLFSCRLEQVYQQAAKLNLNKNNWYQQSPMAQRLRKGDEVGKDYRFKKGQIPPNKGKKTGNLPSMMPTQFKPGQRPANYKPVGSIRVLEDGYLQIKMAEGHRQWVLLHRMIWERLNGKIPTGYLVTFIDGNKANCKITNLTLMTQKENRLRNSIHNYGKEIAHLYLLKGAINRQINKRERLQNERHTST